MEGRGGWPSYAGQVNREPGGAPAGIYGLPSSSLDVPQRGRQLQREAAPHLPPCGSWQAGGGPGGYAGGHTRSLSAPPVELTEHWAVGHTGHPHVDPSGPQHEAWCPQHTARPGPSTHTASQVLPLLAEAPAQPSPSSLLPAEQQAWLKQRLAQAQQQLARQRAEQAAWAAAAAQLLRGRTAQPPHHHPPAVGDEARCPTCGCSGQDSTDATDSQQLEELIDSLEADLEQQLGQLQRRQRWEQQAQRGPALQPQRAGAAWDRRQEDSFQQQPEDPAWDRRRKERQEQERQSLLRMDQEQWQRAAAAAMQQQPLGPQMPSGRQLGQAQRLAGSVAGYSYDAADDCNLVAPVRLSAPARLEHRQQMPVGAASSQPGLLLNRAWQQQQQQHQHQQHQHSWHAQQPSAQVHQPSAQQPSAQVQQQQQSWQQPQHYQHHQQLQQQVASHGFEAGAQPREEPPRTCTQLQLEQQQWASHARELVARSSSGGQPPSWH